MKFYKAVSEHPWTLLYTCETCIHQAACKYRDAYLGYITGLEDAYKKGLMEDLVLRNTPENLVLKVECQHYLEQEAIHMKTPITRF